MLVREVVKDFLEDKLKEKGITIPKGFLKGVLTETFCRYTEDDYYEWLRDNFKTFFNYGNPDWDWIKERIEHYKTN